ncbi:MAG: GH92 family glycosyl hydrolase [Chthoniobacteraceae bacterium]
MTKAISLLLAVALTLGAPECISAEAADRDPVSLVNPFVGTANDGNTYPGPQAPFGMVQLSPNFGEKGYNYDRLTMRGFTLSLMSGVGCDAGGAPLFTATAGEVKVGEEDYSYHYDHKEESASPGYYEVLMQPFGIKAELTASTRCGMARFTFPAGKQANILVPISFANVPTFNSEVERVNGQMLTGHVSTKPFVGAGPKPIILYFAMEFSKPFPAQGSWLQGKLSANSNRAEQEGRNVKAGYYVSYPASEAPQTVTVRVGISYVSVDGAIGNLKAEMPDDKFDDYHAKAVSDWNKELRRIEVKGATVARRRLFYTALYHSLLFPSIFDDADGKYIGFDDAIRSVPDGHKHIYANFSGWDIYRSEWPLLALIEPERAQDMAQSIVEMYKQLGYIDRWPQANRATGCMNGNPLSICLVNLWNANLRNFDIETAYEGMMKASLPTSAHSHVGPYEHETTDHTGVWLNAESNVSSSLEYCVSFAALGRMARALNKPDDANFLIGRALEYRAFYNPETRFLQARKTTGEWANPDDSSAYCEGNKWIYLWFVPQDVSGLVDLMGGASVFEERLDSFLSGVSVFSWKKSQGIHYDPTNEPDIHVPFLYNYIKRPWKTQRAVAHIADDHYAETPGGLSGGNDDLGTMSAWYVLSQLGIYQVDPGVPLFTLFTPRFQEAVLHLGDAGKTFTIKAPQASDPNIYIQSATLNGQAFERAWIEQERVTSGGVLEVKVGAEPNTKWGSGLPGAPSLSTGQN